MFTEFLAVFNKIRVAPIIEPNIPTAMSTSTKVNPVRDTIALFCLPIVSNGVNPVRDTIALLCLPIVSNGVNPVRDTISLLCLPIIACKGLKALLTGKSGLKQDSFSGLVLMLLPYLLANVVMII
jgi:hypothetical protein